jgi:hypothetical protein
MSISPTLKELVAFSDEEIIQKYDYHAKTQYAGLDFYLNEHYRRIQNRQTNAILKYTRWMTILTTVVTIATILNLIMFFVQ